MKRRKLQTQRSGCFKSLQNGHVELKDVTFGYVPGHTILKHISLYAKPGQKIAFVGSTGAARRRSRI